MSKLLIKVFLWAVVVSAPVWLTGLIIWGLYGKW